MTWKEAQALGRVLEDKRVIRLSLLLMGPILLMAYVVAFLIFRHCHTDVLRVAKSEGDLGVLVDATVVYHRGIWKKAGYHVFYPIGIAEYLMTDRRYVFIDYRALE